MDFVRGILHFSDGMVGCIVIGAFTFFLVRLIRPLLFEYAMQRRGILFLGRPPFHPASLFNRSEAIVTVGRLWNARHLHRELWMVTLVVSLFGVYRTFHFENGLELARVSSFVAVAGVLTLAVGLWEIITIKRIWNEFRNGTPASWSSMTLGEILDVPIENANLRAQFISLALTVAGTVMWAYGDQTAACIAFPMMGIPDHAKVCSIDLRDPAKETSSTEASLVGSLASGNTSD